MPKLYIFATLPLTKMRLIALAIALTFVLASTAGNSLASDDLLPLRKEKTLLNILIEKITAIFSVSASEASRSSQEFTQEKISILKSLNKYEMFIRTSMNGADLYLNKDLVLENVKKSKMEIEKSKLSPQSKKKLDSELTAIETEFNKDLIEGPQETLKPSVLKLLNNLEEVVFKMGDNDAFEALKLISTIGV